MRLSILENGLSCNGSYRLISKKKAKQKILEYSAVAQVARLNAETMVFKFLWYKLYIPIFNCPTIDSAIICKHYLTIQGYTTILNINKKEYIKEYIIIIDKALTRQKIKHLHSITPGTDILIERMTMLSKFKFNALKKANNFFIKRLLASINKFFDSKGYKDGILIYNMAKALKDGDISKYASDPNFVC